MKKQIENIFKLINHTNEFLETITFNEINKSKDFKKLKIRINDKVEEKDIKFDAKVKRKKVGHYRTILTGKDVLLLKIKAYGNSENDPTNIFNDFKRTILKIINNKFNSNIYE